MKPNNTHFKKTPVIYLVGILILFPIVLGLVYAQIRLSQNLKKEVNLATNIGKILQYDEILTMSARLAVHSENLDYKKRYVRFEERLTETLNETLALANTQALKAVEATDNANRQLVAMETEAFALLEGGENQAASALLSSIEYQEQKHIYSKGMQQAFHIMEEDVSEYSSALSSLVVLFQVIIIISIAVMVIMWHRLMRKNVIIQKRKAEYDAFRVTLSTVMDTFNNALNNLNYLKIKADLNKGQLEAEDWDIYDQVISDASSRLTDMANMKEFKSEGSGLTRMLAYKASKMKERETAQSAVQTDTKKSPTLCGDF